MKAIVIGILFSFSLYASDTELLLETEKNTVQVYKNAVDSVVNVSNIRIARSMWEIDERKLEQGSGSGFVWDDKGHIVTNYHVINRGNEFLIAFHGEVEKYEAKFIGGDPSKDIAVLKLQKKPKKLVTVKPGASNSLQVGQKTIAIGSPFGLNQTVTTGIVSAKGRKIEGFGGITIHGMIQTDSSINPGNSGGPLLNSRGELIGMNTMIYSSSGSSAGIGFAVPIDTIKRIVPQIIKHGKIIRPGIGIGIVNEYYKYRFGVEKGIIVKSVDPEGPAAKAGIKGLSKGQNGYYIGDVITHVDGKEINSFDDIYNVLDNYKIGDSIEVTYLRENKKKKKVKVKLYEITHE